MTLFSYIIASILSSSWLLTVVFPHSPYVAYTMRLASFTPIQYITCDQITSFSVSNMAVLWIKHIAQ